MKQIVRIIFGVTLLLVVSGCGGGGGDGSGGACGPLTKVFNGESCGDTRSVVRLSILQPTGGSGSCTGTFISQTSVLTAAHCIIGGLGLPFQRPIGIDVIFNGSATAAEGWIVPRNYVVSETRGQFQGNFDIAIVKVDESFMPSVGAVPQPILRSRIPAQGEAVIINGFGVTESGAPSRDVLQAAEVTFFGLDDSNRIVLVPTSDNVGVCSGDSGSPLLARAENGEYGITGVTSFTQALTDNVQCGFGSQNVFAPLFNNGNIAFIDQFAPDAPKI